MKKIIVILFIIISFLSCKRKYEIIDNRYCIDTCIDDFIHKLKPQTSMLSSIKIEYDIKEVIKYCTNKIKKYNCIGKFIQDPLSKKWNLCNKEWKNLNNKGVKR